MIRAADVAEALVRAIPTLPIELHLEVHAKIVTALTPALKAVRKQMRAECVAAIQHVPGYADLLYKDPQHMHRAVEDAVKRVRC